MSSFMIRLLLPIYKQHCSKQFHGKVFRNLPTTITINHSSHYCSYFKLSYSRILPPVSEENGLQNQVCDQDITMNVKSQSVFQIHVFGIAFNPIYWKMEEFWSQHKSNKIVSRRRKFCELPHTSNNYSKTVAKTYVQQILFLHSISITWRLHISLSF